MSGHTAGPWRIEEKPRPDGFLDIVSTHFSIAVVMGGLDDGPFDVGPIQSANARLIAAAPDLLAALYEVAHHADDECGFMVNVRAAIAKAEGR